MAFLTALEGAGSPFRSASERVGATGRLAEAWSRAVLKR